MKSGNFLFVKPSQRILNSILESNLLRVNPSLSVQVSKYPRQMRTLVFPPRCAIAQCNQTICAMKSRFAQLQNSEYKHKKS